MHTIASNPVDLPGASAPQALRTTFAWTAAGNVVYALANFGMLSALAKLSTTAAVGQFALGLAISVPVFVFCTLQLRAVHVTDARSEYSFADYFTLRCVGLAVGFVFILGIVLVGRYDRNTSAIILLVAVAKAIESVADGTAGLMQKADRLDQAARSLILRGAVAVPVFALVFRASHRVTLAVGAVAVAWAAIWAAYDLPIARALLGGARFSGLHFGTLKRLTSLSLPLGFVIGLLTLNAYVPRYVVLRYGGAEQLGIFTSLAYCITAVNLVVYALGQSVSVRLARMFALGDLDGFTRILKRLVLVGASFSAAGVPAAILFGRPILTLLFRPEYAQHAGLLPLLAIVAGVGATGLFLNFGMTAARCFRSQLPIIGAATVSAVLISLLSVPSHGLYGAAYALLASSIVLVIGNAAVLIVAVGDVRGSYVSRGAQDECCVYEADR